MIDRAERGDSAARHDLLERYRDYLRRMIAARLDRRLAPRVDASDIVQETLTVAASRIDDYLVTKPLPFFGWLRKLAGEQVIQAHRRHVLTQRRTGRSRELHSGAVGRIGHRFARSSSPPTPARATAYSTRSVKSRCWRAWRTLTDRDREVLVMRHFEHLTTANIAEALGITEVAVKARLLRAVHRLRSRLEAFEMIDNVDPLAPNVDEDPELAALSEEITRRLERGEIVDLNEYQRAYPYLAAPIRGLIPTLHTLVMLGRAINPVAGTNGHAKDEACR